MSWRPVVRTGLPTWHSNELRFGTEQEALDSAAALAVRWKLVTDWSARSSDDPVTHRHVDGEDIAI